jgi:hypothetical protein
MPSKKKMAKMPAEAPKAAPMGPLFGICQDGGFLIGFRVVEQGSLTS